MKKMKKAFLGVILSCLMALCLCIGAMMIKPTVKNVSADTASKETTSITNMHVRDSFFLFFLGTNDYANAGANTSVGSAGLSAYNTLEIS